MLVRYLASPLRRAQAAPLVGRNGPLVALSAESKSVEKRFALLLRRGSWLYDPGRGRSQVNMAYIGWATHVPQGFSQRAASVKTVANPQRKPQFGLRTASCTHEAETVSNRASGCHGEARSGSAHTAHHARKVWITGEGLGRCLAPDLGS